MTSFEKLVDQVDGTILDIVDKYLEDVIGSVSEEVVDITHQRVLVALAKKHRPKDVILVEEEEVEVPQQHIYAVYDTLGTWLYDVSGRDEGELYGDLCDAMNADIEEGDLLMEGYFTIGQPEIKFECRRQYFTLKKR